MNSEKFWIGSAVGTVKDGSGRRKKEVRGFVNRPRERKKTLCLPIGSDKHEISHTTDKQNHGRTRRRCSKNFPINWE